MNGAPKLKDAHTAKSQQLRVVHQRQPSPQILNETFVGFFLGQFLLGRYFRKSPLRDF